jgi:hypothetical protein
MSLDSKSTPSSSIWVRREERREERESEGGKEWRTRWWRGREWPLVRTWTEKFESRKNFTTAKFPAHTSSHTSSHTYTQRDRETEGGGGEE